MSTILEQIEADAAKEQAELAKARKTYAEILRRDVAGDATGDDANLLRKAMKLLHIDVNTMKEHRERLAELAEQQKALPRDDERQEAQRKVAALWRDHNTMVERHRIELAEMNQQIAAAELITRGFFAAIRAVAELKKNLQDDYPILFDLPDAATEPEKLTVLGPQWDHAIEHDAVQVD